MSFFLYYLDFLQLAQVGPGLITVIVSPALQYMCTKKDLTDAVFTALLA